MIEIVTLFLGLVTGTQPVELAVSPGVAGVEVRLDGELVEVLESAPWRLEVDLGEALLPHELVAVALDDGGRELGRARRWVNIDLPRIEVDGRAPAGGLTPLPIVFEQDRVPPPDELGAWLRAGGEPIAVSGVETGPAEVVIVQDPRTRPALEPLARLYLSYRLDQIGFPVEVPDPAAESWHPDLLRLPEKEFRQAAREAFSTSTNTPESRQIGLLWKGYLALGGLGDETRVRFVSPLAAPISRTTEQRNLFMQSVSVPDAGLFWLARELPPMSFAYRIADAVAVAGREVHAAGRRRAVVLLLHGDPGDQSLYPAAAARDYLRALRVPLFVWSVSRADVPAGWGEPRFIGFPGSEEGKRVRSRGLGETYERVAEATGELRRELARQRIVWLSGEHLPHRIELVGGTAVGRPAGVEPRPEGGRRDGRERGKKEQP